MSAEPQSTTPAEASQPDTALEGESETQRIERLGRQRPEKLDSLWKEFGFVFSIIMSQTLTEYFVGGFNVLLPTVVEELNVPETSVTWPASVVSLVLSAFLLPFGRLADIYGGFPVYMGGWVWYAVWSLIAGFSQNEYMLDVCRALQGLGPAAFLPGGLTLLGSMYRPGPRKNLVFSIYGAMAPLGFFVGIFFAGVAGEFATWSWYFWVGTMLASIVAVISYFCIPNDAREHKNNGVKMDWWGSLTTITGTILFVFAITDSGHVGWETPYILVTFLLGIVILCIAFYIEGWVAEQPLLPFEILKIKYVRPFILGLLFAYGTLGIYLLYATLYIRNILNVSAIRLVAWYVPFALGGCILASLGGLILHRIHGNILLLLTTLAILASSLLFALQPINPTFPVYWAYVFPAMVCATLAIDLVFNVANIFFTSQLPARQQGLAGALSNVLLQLSIAVLLGFADVVVNETAWQGTRESYQNAFWFEFACGATALVVFMGFVRIERARSDLTADEKAALAAGEEAQG